MPVTRKLLRTVTASLAVLPNAGFALGLGSIEVESALDQPLDARIPIVSLRPGEIEGLSAGLASRELFERMGFERPLMLSQLKFSVEDRGGDRPYIRVTSSAPIREPLLDLLVEVRWSSGRLLRDYAVLLDPPITVRRSRPENAIAPYSAGGNSAPSAVARAGVAGTSAVRRVAPSSQRLPAGTFKGNEYGPVASGETLWSIASNTRPDRAVSVQQMMLALLRANPEGFFAPNVNNLNAGARLRIPERSEIASLTKDEALEEVRQQHLGNDGYTVPAASVAVKLVKPGAAMSLEDDPAAAEPQAGSETGSRDRGAEQGDSGTALIRVENGGISLQLAGMDDLNRHIPTIVAVEDLTLASGAVSAMVDEKLATTAGGPVTAFGAPALESGAAKFDSQWQAPGEPAATSRAEVPPAPEPAGTVVQASLPEVLESAEPAAVTDTDMSSEPASAMVSPNPDPALVVPVEPVTGPSVDSAPTLDAIASTETPALLATPDADAPMVGDAPAAGTDVTAFEPAAPAGAATWMSSVLAILNDPRSLAIAGGGVLLFLLLVLLLVRRALARGTEPSPEQVAPTAGDALLVSTAPMPMPVIQPVSVPSESAPAPTPKVAAEQVDPAAQADILLAMGDAGPAAELLEQALAADSGRDDLAYKLLEARHAEGNRGGYVQAAERYRGRLEDGRLWEQVLAMGSELAPEHPLFAVAQEENADWLLTPEAEAKAEEEEEEEVEVEVAAVAPVSKTATEVQPPPPPLPTESSDVLEFVLPDREPKAVPSPAREADLDLEDGLEFDLDQFSMDKAETAEAEDVGRALEEEFGKLGDSEPLELGIEDSAADGAPMLEETPLTLPASDGGEVLDFPSQQDLTVSLPTPEDETVAEDDSFVDTKLDLATAYLEMGDDSGARTLYEEVVDEGNELQRKQAQEALKQIGFG